MTDSAPPEIASLPDPVTRPGASRLAKFVGQLKRVRGPIVAIASIGAILSGIVGYWTAYDTVHNVVVPKSTPTAVTVGTTEAPHTPLAFSVAILPFAAPSASPVDEQFAEALTNELSMALARTRWWRVVSHSLADGGARGPQGI